MTDQRGSTDARVEERLRVLEAALDAAIERARAAKNVARQAKEDAKLAKKDKRRARKALIQAQEEYGLNPVSEADADGSVAKPVRYHRIANSPERRPRRRVKKKTTKTKDAGAALPEGAPNESDSPVTPTK